MDKNTTDFWTEVVTTSNSRALFSQASDSLTPEYVAVVTRCDVRTLWMSNYLIHYVILYDHPNIPTNHNTHIHMVHIDIHMCVCVCVGTTFLYVFSSRIKAEAGSMPSYPWWESFVVDPEVDQPRLDITKNHEKPSHGWAYPPWNYHRYHEWWVWKNVSPIKHGYFEHLC